MRTRAEGRKAQAIQNLRAVREAVLEAAAAISPDVAGIVFLGE